jgi:hypothetical protein
MSMKVIDIFFEAVYKTQDGVHKKSPALEPGFSYAFKPTSMPQPART